MNPQAHVFPYHGLSATDRANSRTEIGVGANPHGDSPVVAAPESDNPNVAQNEAIS